MMRVKPMMDQYAFIIPYETTHHKGTINECSYVAMASVHGWVDFYRLTEKMRSEGVIIKVLHDID
jgi:hypothetical protein